MNLELQLHQQIIFKKMKKLIFIILFLFPYICFGANNYSADFEDSSSQYFSITDANQNNLDLNSDFTIEAWVKVESTISPRTMGIVTKWLGTGNQRSYAMQFNAPDMYLYTSDDGNPGSSATVGHNITPGEWLHIALTYDKSEGQIEYFENGQSQGTGSGVDTTIFNGTAEVQIGGLGGSTFFDGLIDDVRIWNDLRTQQEISDFYQCQLNGDEEGLISNWNFENNANDSNIVNANDLTNNNSVTYSTGVPYTNSCYDEEEGTTTDIIIYNNSNNILYFTVGLLFAIFIITFIWI